jgi:hypothetical protein
MDGVNNTAWGVAKVVGIARGMVELGEAGDEGATQILGVRPPKVVVRLPASVQGLSDHVGSRLDHPRLF